MSDLRWWTTGGWWHPLFKELTIHLVFHLSVAVSCITKKSPGEVDPQWQRGWSCRGSGWTLHLSIIFYYAINCIMSIKVQSILFFSIIVHKWVCRWAIRIRKVTSFTCKPPYYSSHKAHIQKHTKFIIISLHAVKKAKSWFWWEQKGLQSLDWCVDQTLSD